MDLSIPGAQLIGEASLYIPPGEDPDDFLASEHVRLYETETHKVVLTWLLRTTDDFPDEMYFYVGDSPSTALESVLRHRDIEGLDVEAFRNAGLETSTLLEIIEKRSSRNLAAETATQEDDRALPI